MARWRTRVLSCGIVCLSAIAVVSTGAAPIAPPTGGDKTGVHPHRIKIGVHASITGQVPLPSDDISKGARLYFKWRKHLGRPIFKRRVNVVLRNDNGDEAQARAVCKEMAEEENVFLLMSYGGTGASRECAEFADGAGIPYVSAGAAAQIPRDFKTFFATTMPFKSQGPLLADFLISAKEARHEENAIVTYNLAHYRRATRRFARAMEARDSEVTYTRRLPTTANKEDADTVVADMKALGIENAYVLVSPIFFLQMLDSAEKQQFEPLWTGPGLTMTTEGFANVGCSYESLAGARFFSPFPPFQEARDFDRHFLRALKELYPDEGSGNDVLWHGWAMGKMLAKLLALPRRHLSRERFVYFVERAEGVRNGISPTLSFAPRDHFGARHVHLLRPDCVDERWRTVKAFVRNF